MPHRNQLILGVVIAAIIAGGGGFYGGMQYEKSKPRDGSQFAGNRGGQPGQGRQFGGMRGGPNGENGDFATGEITAKDDKSITIKARDGASKIIFFSDSTTVNKSEQGGPSDLNNGQQVMITGKNNPDGSMAAQNIQIHPQQ